MTQDEILRHVVQALSAVAPEVDFSKIRPNLPIRDQVDIDSYDFLNIIVALHDRLAIDIPESDYQQLATLDSTVSYLTRRLTSPTQ